QQNRVNSAADLENWVRRWLAHAVGPLEGVLVAAVHRAALAQNWSAAVSANEILWTSLTASTLRHASRDMGEQLLALSESWPWAAGLTAAMRQALPEGQWHHAPVFGALASACGGSPVEAVAVFLHQATLGMISAGVRAIPIGHT